MVIITLNVCLHINAFKISVESTHSIMFGCISGSSLVSMFTLVNKSFEIRKCLKYHSEVDLKFKQLRIFMEYHYIVIWLSVVSVFNLGYLTYIILNIYNIVKVGGPEMMTNCIILSLSIPVYYHNGLILSLYAANCVLVIIKFYKITKYLDGSINMQYNCAYAKKTSKLIFPLIIDVHCRLCQIYNLMSQNLAVAFLYNLHIFILFTSFLTYAHIHGYIYAGDYIMNAVYGFSVIGITILNTYAHKIVSPC